MTVKIITLLILWATTGCAQPPYEFEVYVARFEKDAAANGCKQDIRRFKIEFEDPKPFPGRYAIGECLYDENRIIVRKTAWDRFGEWDREQLIYHELGHCVLHLQHRDNTIMQTTMLSPKEYYENRNFLVKHLFYGCNK